MRGWDSNLRPSRHWSLLLALLRGAGSNPNLAAYARVVPLSDDATALPANDGAIDNYQTASRPGELSHKRIVMETEALHPGRIAFIRGNRKAELSDLFDVTIAGFREPQTNTQWSVARGMGHGVDRMQRLASFEYLQRYFAVVLRRVTIQLNTPIDAAAVAALPSSGLIGQYKGRLAAGSTMASTGDIARLAAVEIARVENLKPDKAVTVNDWAGGAGTQLYQGVFARDVHPFLRGKGLSPQLVDALTGGRGASGQAMLSRCVGDELAFALLQERMSARGMTDWRPDGIVLGKDHVGPDEDADSGFDARLGQLFNVVIQGPAITTNYVGDYKKRVLPGDKVFVVIMCDVYFGADIPAGKIKDAQDLKEVTEQALKDAATERDTLLRTFDWATFLPVSEAGFKAANNAGKNNLLANFRLRLTTSSEMIHYSGVTVPAAPAGAPKIPAIERMGLKLGNTMGEYIVGGWQIGTVTDAAASRAALPGQFDTKSDPSSYAINVYTSIEWWSGDRMFRTFCDIEKKLRTRYEDPKAAVELEQSKRWEDRPAAWQGP